MMTDLEAEAPTRRIQGAAAAIRARREAASQKGTAAGRGALVGRKIYVYSIEGSPPLTLERATANASALC